MRPISCQAPDQLCFITEYSRTPSQPAYVTKQCLERHRSTNYKKRWHISQCAKAVQRHRHICIPTRQPSFTVFGALLVWRCTESSRFTSVKSVLSPSESLRIAQGRVEAGSHRVRPGPRVKAEPWHALDPNGKGCDASMHMHNQGMYCAEYRCWL